MNDKWNESKKNVTAKVQLKKRNELKFINQHYDREGCKTKHNGRLDIGNNLKKLQKWVLPDHLLSVIINPTWTWYRE